MLTRTLRPMDPLTSTLSQFDRFFVPILRGVEQHVNELQIGGPRLNAFEKSDGFMLEVELPGYRHEDIEVTAQGDQVTIKGSRSISTPEQSNVIRAERLAGSFERSLRLPAQVNPNGVSAVMSNGVLTITLPKSEVAMPRRIPISNG